MKISRTIVVAVLLALLAVAAVAVAAAIAPGSPQAKAAEDAVLTVTVNGADPVSLTMTQLKALPEYSGYSGFVDSHGDVTRPEPLKGALVTDVLAAAGVTMTSLNACDITAPDNYGMTFTYDNVFNHTGVQWYDVVNDGGKDKAVKADPKAEWQMVIAYEQSGSPIPPDQGPLRLVIAQQTNENQVVDGHLLVKWTSKINLRGAVADWKVKMYGLKGKNGKRQTYTLDRASYDSCAAPGCHGNSWLNPTTKKTWSGVPLFLCIGKVDGGPGHDSYNAFNEALALKGYRIKLVSATGRYAILGSRTVRNKTSIILANKLMGSDLTTRYYPLRLVGPVKWVASSKSIGRVSKIYLLPK
jgi:DMSO/TMAO reductase YedYZ molybdopterin-dependent catalytic subunit